MMENRMTDEEKYIAVYKSKRIIMEDNADEIKKQGRQLEDMQCEMEMEQRRLALLLEAIWDGSPKNGFYSYICEEYEYLREYSRNIDTCTALEMERIRTEYDSLMKQLDEADDEYYRKQRALSAEG